MRIRVKTAKSDIAFYAFWSFLQLGKGLGYTASNPYFIVLLACGIPFAAIKIFLTKWDFGSFQKFFFLNILGAVVTVFSGTTTYWLSIFCITAAKDMDLKKILKINLIVRGPLFVLRTSLAIMGVTDMEMEYRFADDMISGIRYALGYDHPNTTQFKLFMLIAIFFFLYSNRVKLYHYLVAAIYNYFIYSYTDSRTPFILCAVFLVGMIFVAEKRKNIVGRFLLCCSKGGWIVCMLLSGLGCLAYTCIPWFQDLDTFSSRFLTAVTTITEQYLPLFGTRGVTTDLGYVYIVYNGGLIVAALFFVGINKLLQSEFIRNEKALLWALACLSVFAILEHSVFSVIANGLLLYLRYIVYPADMKAADSIKKVE